MPVARVDSDDRPEFNVAITYEDNAAGKDPSLVKLAAARVPTGFRGLDKISYNISWFRFLARQE
jgi:hypothetical protein